MKNSLTTGGGAISRRALLAAVPALAIVPGLSGQRAFAQGGSPQDIIAGLYRAYQQNKVPAPAYTPAVNGRMRSKRPDFDFLIDGQDWQIGKLQVRQVSAAGDAATVEAHFTNFGRPTRVRFALRRIGGRWLIANVRHLHKGSRFDLRRHVGLRPLP